MKVDKTGLFCIRFISWVFVVACMICIYNFSAEPVEESHKTSGSFIEGVLNEFSEEYQQSSEEKKKEIVSGAQAEVRKVAHFAIFSLLGFLVSLALYTYKINKYVKWIIPSVFCCLYAVFDEVHQLHVSGRTGRPLDVIIDTAGGIVGIVVFICVVLVISKVTEKIKKKENEGI